MHQIIYTPEKEIMPWLAHSATGRKYAVNNAQYEEKACTE